MLTININIQDRIGNGQLGTIKHINLDMHSNFTKIYIKLMIVKLD